MDPSPRTNRAAILEAYATRRKAENQAKAAQEQAAIDALGLGGLTIAQHQAKFRSGPPQPTVCAVCGFADGSLIPFGVGPWTWMHEDCWHLRK